MKLNYTYKSFSTVLFYFLMIAFTASCTIYQDVPDNDGIYSSETRGNKVILVNNKDYQEYENDYFTQELERIDLINGTDILTDIETYNSINSNDTLSTITSNSEGYNPNSSWGYNDSEDVVVNINLINDGFLWNNYWNYYDPYLSFGYLNPWYSRSLRFGWRNRWGYPYYWGGYGYFMNPFYNGFGPFYNPYYYGIPRYGLIGWGNYYGNGFGLNRLRNYNYGRRANYYSAYNRSGANRISRRATTSSNRRVNFTNGRRNNRPVRDIDLDNLASNLRIDKNKIKVYNKPNNVPSRSRRVSTTINDKNSNSRTGIQSRANYKSRNTNSRSTSPQRSPSVRRSSPSRSMNMSRSRGSSIQRSSPSRSSGSSRGGSSRGGSSRRQ